MGIILYTTLAVSVTSICYLKLWVYKYWNRVGLSSVNTSLPFAQANNILFKRNTIAEEFKNVYDELKLNKKRHGGTYFFTKPVYVPVDPEIINSVLNGREYTSRGMYFNKNKDKMFNSLFYSDDTENCEKIRLIFKELFNEDGIALYTQDNVNIIQSYFDNLDAESNVDCSELFQNLQVNIIKNMFFQNANNLKFNHLKNMLQLFSTPEENTSFKFLFGLVNSNILKCFFTRVSIKKCLSFFVEELNKEIQYRNDNNTEINDFFNVINLRDVKEDKLQLLITLILSNFKTVSNVISFCLYELKKNSNVYENLMKELSNLDKDEKLTPETLKKLTYLDKVIKETLRKYPVVPIIKRINTKNVAVPYSSICLEENTDIIISTYGIQNDPENFPDPDLFKPERFNNSENIKTCTFIPFGTGPRHCIGQEIALIQIKLILLLFLKNFSYTLDVDSDITYQKRQFYMKPEDSKINIKKN